MKIIITNESGDCKEMLFTKDKITFEVKDPEIVDFFHKLNEAYNDDKVIDDMYECLYNLINYGYLYADEEEVDYDNFDDDDYDDYDDDFDDDYDDYEDEEDEEDDDDVDVDENKSEKMQLIETVIEYYVDGELVSKAEYDDAWDYRVGYLGSSNWEEKGLNIINATTDEVIFVGKI